MMIINTNHLVRYVPGASLRSHSARLCLPFATILPCFGEEWSKVEYSTSEIPRARGLMLKVFKEIL